MRMMIATLLAYAASKVAPPKMKPVFRCYCDMLDDFTHQIRMGREYGVVTAIWFVSEINKSAAEFMREKAEIALDHARQSLQLIRAGDLK